MTYRNDDPDYVTLTISVGVRTIVSVDVEVQVPREIAGDLAIDPEDAVHNLDAEIVRTHEADSETFNDSNNIEALNAAAAEALAEYRATLVTP